MSNTQLYRKVYCSRALPHKSGYYDSEHGKLYYDKKTEVWGLDSKPKYWLEPVQDHSREQEEWIDITGLRTLATLTGMVIYGKGKGASACSYKVSVESFKIGCTPGFTMKQINEALYIYDQFQKS